MENSITQVDCLGEEQDDITRYLSKAAQKRVPLAVSLELTRRCSFRCVHCYLGDQEHIRKHRDQEMNTAMVMGLLDEMVAAGVLFLTLTGGDPMVRSDFLEIYRHAVRSGLLVTVFCNGSLITNEIVNTFVTYPPRAVEVTLYGASKETFDAVTQLPGSFEACMNGIEQLCQAKVRLRLKSILLTLNLAEQPIFWQIAEEKKVHFRQDCSIIPALSNGDNGGRSNTGNSLFDTLQFRLTPKQATEADLSTVNVLEKLKKRIQHSGQTEPVKQLYRCGAARSSCHITPYGVMQPCVMTLHISVDLNQGDSFQAAWSSMSRDFAAQEVSQDFPCHDCNNRNVCTGCPSYFAAETGNTQEPAAFYCQYAACRNERIIFLN